MAQARDALHGQASNATEAGEGMSEGTTDRAERPRPPVEQLHQITEFLDQTDMNTEQTQILLELLRRTRLIEANNMTEERVFWHSSDINHENEHGPFWHAGRWFGKGERLPEAQRQRYVRALRDLAAKNMVILACRWANKTTNAKFTPEGRAEAERLEGSLSVRS